LCGGGSEEGYNGGSLDEHGKGQRRKTTRAHINLRAQQGPSLRHSRGWDNGRKNKLELAGLQLLGLRIREHVRGSHMAGRW